MSQSNKEDNNARPRSGRAFLSRTEVSIDYKQFLHRIKLPDFIAHLIYWPLVTIGITLDLWTKRAVFDWLEQKQGNSVSIVSGFLQLVMAENTGAAFGIASGQRYFLTTISVVALVAILGIFLFSGIKQRLIHIALGLFTAGVCGNLWDRVFNGGRVRDFIDVYYSQYHWPAFNVADSMLCIAVGLLIISSLRVSQHHS